MSDAEASSNERPEVSRFTDYRAFLRAMIEHLRAVRPGFSFASFARDAGFASKSFLKLVSDGKRNLSQESARRMAAGLGLDAEERAIFETLVRLEQATRDADKNRHYARLARLTSGEPTVELQAGQYEAFSRWYPLVIRELIGTSDFKSDASWIGRRLRPKIRPEAVRRALELLERVGLVARDGDGQLEIAEQPLTTGPQVRSLAVRNFHRAMLELAIGSLDEVASEERDVTGLTLPLTAEQFERVRQVLARTRREVLEIWGEGPEAPEEGAQEVFHVGFTLVPVTQPVKGKEK